MKDWSTHEGARDLARKVRAYWAARGYDNVFTGIEVVGPESKGRSGIIYGVTSNMRNGHPPKLGRQR